MWYWSWRKQSYIIATNVINQRNESIACLNVDVGQSVACQPEACLGICPTYWPTLRSNLAAYLTDWLLACHPPCLLACQPLWLFAFLTVTLPGCLHDWLLVCLAGSTTSLSVSQPAYLFGCFPLCLPDCISFWLSAFLSAWLLLSLSRSLAGYLPASLMFAYLPAYLFDE